MFFRRIPARPAFSILAASAVVVWGCTTNPETPATQFVAISDAVPDAVLDIRYAGPKNFLGLPVRGYEGPECLLTPEAAKSLKRAAAALSRATPGSSRHSLQLHVFDCFRPQRAVDHFVTWAADAADTLEKSEYYPDVPKDSLFAHGYIAARSGHSRGSTIDLSLSREGVLLDMGTPFDYFDPTSATADTTISGIAQANRTLLKALMEEAGFRNYSAEWWHYTLIDEPWPDVYFDGLVR